MPEAVRVGSGLIQQLEGIAGGRVTTAAGVREQHGHDESFHPVHPPEAVVFPESAEEVAAIVRACVEAGAPIIPYGTGTAVEGQVNAVDGGVCIDLSRMDRIIAVHAEDMIVVVEPGVTRKRLNEYLRDTGLFFPVDPGADASLGGMAATRASGTNAVRYGTMRDNVAALAAVMADGTLIRAGRRTRKSSTGYDLAHLLVGSEGTLGVITELSLRLHPVPECIISAVASFPDIAGAVDSVVATIQSAVPVARIELLDEVQMEAINRYSGLACAVQPTLFLELHGTAAAAEAQAVVVQGICEDHHGSNFAWASRPEDRARLWQARHDAYYAAKALRPGFTAWTTDVCVPMSRLTDCIVETKRDIAETGLTAPLVGHVGDGNFHLVILTDPSRPEQAETAQRLHRRLVERALAMDGTCSGEHGIGLGKLQFMAAEHGPALGVMAAIKRALDPHGLMNPAKLLPKAAESAVTE